VNSPGLWGLADTGAEQTILERAIHEVQTAVLVGNSTGPGKVQPGANKNGQCKQFLAGNCNHKGCRFAHTGKPATPGAAKPPQQHVPTAFTALHAATTPKICMRYAYFGACTKAVKSKKHCINASGNISLHTCVLCLFAKGKHAIKDGKHPSGVCP
jgi:hypothetical protein